MATSKKLVLLGLLVSCFAFGQGLIDQLTVDNLRLDGNTISTINSNGHLVVSPNGTGKLEYTPGTATTVPYLDASKRLTSSSVTPTELGYLSGVTSAIQTQLDGKQASGSYLTITGAATVTTKTIDGDDNTVQDLAITALKTVVGNASKFLSFDGSGAPEASKAVPSGVVVGTTDSQTLTNKVLTSPTINTPTADVVLWDDTTTPANPSAGIYKTYFKNDGKLYKLNSSGVEEEIGSGTGGGSSGINMLSAYNNNAELGATTFWSEDGGGTLAVTSTADNVANGTYAFSFDASAADDFAESGSVTVPAGLYGQNCLLQFYYKGFDSNVTVKVYETTNLLTSQALTAASTYTVVQLNFVCPSSSTMKVHFYASADAAIGYWDEVHLGSAINLTNVSQASFIGSAYFATTTGCTFTRTNTVLGALSDTDCPGPTVEANPGPGTIQTTDTNAPIVTINNLPPGRYMVGFIGASGTSATPAFAAASISDGTTQSGQAGINIHASVIAPFHLMGTFVYTVSGNRSFELFVSSSANAVNVHNSASDQRLMFYIYRFPSSAELTSKPDAAQWRIDANIAGADISLGTAAQSAYITPSNAGLTLTTNSGSAAVGISCTLTNDNANLAATCPAGDEEPGITTNIPRAGTIEWCFDFSHSMQLNSTGVVNATFQVVETANGSQTISVEGKSRLESGLDVSASSNGSNPLHLCGTITHASAGRKTIRVMYEQTTTATVTTNVILADAGASNGQRDIHVTARYVDQQSASPVVVNSVVNPRSGVTGICSAFVTNSGTASVTRSDGNCLVFSSDNGNGDSTFTFATGTFSGTPNCTCTVETTSQLQGCMIDSTTALSSTVVRIQTSNASAAGFDHNFHLICIGPK